MTTHFDEGDEGPDIDPDDPLTVILRPSSAEYLGPPPGRYETIRRGANRRRLLRATVGAGATCAVIVLAALPFRLAHHDSPTTPTVPLAPPPASSAPTTPPSPAPAATQVPSPRASASQSSPTASRNPSRTPVPTMEPSRAPTASASAPSSVPTSVPSATTGQ
ncbi:hypothetical protein [Streptomyces sp. N50]|uniref:hypothetical protein n=1 Tax=Streptomyces sp. N50 TaxID=3081765 RepID=UPI00296258D2|nr:hypothetical protein [Streptomyces sp. N50]WOX12932.1 hypothetical protein R2B38_30730 [Streptomyces sp. N50]